MSNQATTWPELVAQAVRHNFELVIRPGPKGPKIGARYKHHNGQRCTVWTDWAQLELEPDGEDLLAKGRQVTRALYKRLAKADLL